MVKTRNNLLSLPRLATKREIEDLEAIENRKIETPHYIEEPIAEILGIDALYPENDIRNLLVKELESNINELKGKDIDKMSFEELRRWSKWIGTVDNTVDKSISVIESAKELLRQENLIPFINLLESHDDIKLFRQFLQGISVEKHEIA
jgi:hypothetical protein